jgi:hypothetical protein
VGAVVFALVVGVGVGVGVDSDALRREGSTTVDTGGSVSIDVPDGLVRPGTPCGDAVAVATSGRPTMDVARELADRSRVSVFLPDAEPARAWVCGEAAPVLVYRDVQVSFEAGWGDVDVEEKWSRSVEESGGYVQRLSGVSALVQPVSDRLELAQVMAVRDGVLIQLLGTSAETDIDGMIEMARQALAARPVSPSSK